jgi:hypothetical protein
MESWVKIGSLIATLRSRWGALGDGRVETKRGQVWQLLDVKARGSRGTPRVAGRVRRDARGTCRLGRKDVRMALVSAAAEPGRR